MRRLPSPTVYCSHAVWSKHLPKSAHLMPSGAAFTTVNFPCSAVLWRTQVTVVVHLFKDHVSDCEIMSRCLAVRRGGNALAYEEFFL